MKKIYTLAALTFFAMAASAQTMIVHFKNGTKVEFSKETVDYVDFAEKSADPTLTAGDYVDLGLPSGTKWATCNVGATKPTELGNKYAWGETSTKSLYSESTYAYYNSSTATYTDIGSDISGTQYDAATVNLGKEWRMPTKEEVKELYNKCTLTWTSVEGCPGYLVEGPNGNTIFLKSDGTGTYDYTYFWTSTNYTSSNNHNAYDYYFNSSSTVCMNAWTTREKYYGYYIRPVYVGTNTSNPTTGIENITDYVTVTRTGQSTTISGAGIAYVVTFSIKNTSTEKIHLVSLAGVSIDKDLDANGTHSISLQSSTTYLQNYKQTLVFTYNGKSYEVKG